MLLALALAVAAAPDTLDAKHRPQIDAALAEIRKANPQIAIDTLDPVIAAYEAAYKDEKRTIYCGMTPEQSLAYMLTAASEADKGTAKSKAGAIAIGSGYCSALYLKGFALIDLNRLADARVYYERVIALAPSHSLYLAEMGQTYRYDKDWAKMLDYCGRAADAAGLAEKSSVNAMKAMSWRCMAYAKIELGAWDDAEKLFKDCLKLDPNDEKAKAELRYIAENRPKRV